MPTFEKVSLEDFASDVVATLGSRVTEEEMRAAYERIVLPVRADAGSAGYDFVTPFKFKLGRLHRRVRIPTGIRAKFGPDEALLILPRSGKGCSTGYHLTNTVGVIDSSYYGNPSNGGDIIVCLSRGHGDLRCEAGDRFAQGLFVRVDVFDGEAVGKGQRKGGFGSSGR